MWLGSFVLSPLAILSLSPQAGGAPPLTVSGSIVFGGTLSLNVSLAAPGSSSTLATYGNASGRFNKVTTVGSGSSCVVPVPDYQPTRLVVQFNIDTTTCFASSTRRLLMNMLFSPLILTCTW